MEHDDETGLEYHNARYYIAWLGRWMNCDPIGIEDGMNVYAYCKNNPIGSVDKEGTHSEDNASNSHLKDDVLPVEKNIVFTKDNNEQNKPEKGGNTDTKSILSNDPLSKDLAQNDVNNVSLLGKKPDLKFIWKVLRVLNPFWWGKEGKERKNE